MPVPGIRLVYGSSRTSDLPNVEAYAHWLLKCPVSGRWITIIPTCRVGNKSGESRCVS